MTEIDDRPEPCTLPGHVPGCPGRAGGDHEYTPDKAGRLARQLDDLPGPQDAAAREEDRRFEQYRDDRIMERYERGHRG